MPAERGGELVPDAENRIEGRHGLLEDHRDVTSPRSAHRLGAEAVKIDVSQAYFRGVESCLTSNVQTNTVGDYASHPLNRFLDHGLLATINTDDPGISAIDLPYEFEVAAPAAGLAPAQARQAQRNALQVAFLSEQERAELAASRQLDPATGLGVS